MPMHECFSGLFAATPINGVARVSGVSSSKSGQKSSELPDPEKKNTSCNTNADGVLSAVNETPCIPVRQGEGVSIRSVGIQHITPAETHETYETPSERDSGNVWREKFHERAAMVEYEGAFPRHMADAVAYWDTFLRFAASRYPVIRAEFDAIINEHSMN